MCVLVALALDCSVYTERDRVRLLLQIKMSFYIKVLTGAVSLRIPSKRERVYCQILFN